MTGHDDADGHERAGRRPGATFTTEMLNELHAEMVAGPRHTPVERETEPVPESRIHFVVRLAAIALVLGIVWVLGGPVAFIATLVLGTMFLVVIPNGRPQTRLVRVVMPLVLATPLTIALVSSGSNTGRADEEPTEITGNWSNAGTDSVLQDLCADAGGITSLSYTRQQALAFMRDEHDAYVLRGDRTETAYAIDAPATDPSRSVERLALVIRGPEAEGLEDLAMMTAEFYSPDSAGTAAAQSARNRGLAMHNDDWPLDQGEAVLSMHLMNRCPAGFDARWWANRLRDPASTPWNLERLPLPTVPISFD